jgi:hypothetical protein
MFILVLICSKRERPSGFAKRSATLLIPSKFLVNITVLIRVWAFRQVALARLLNIRENKQHAPPREFIQHGFRSP